MQAEEGLWRPRLYLPAYTVAEAARYADTNAQTISNWHFRPSSRGPVLPGRMRGDGGLSYLQLVEVAFVATARKYGITPKRIRDAREYLAKAYGSAFPFAELRLKTDRVHIFAENDAPTYSKELVRTDENGQLAWEKVIEERIVEFEYEQDLAIRWHPRKTTPRVAIDPRIAFGAPQVWGVPTLAIKGRWMAGETVDDIMGDFDLQRPDVLEGLWFEGIQEVA